MNTMTVVELKFTHEAFDMRDPYARQYAFLERSHTFHAAELGPHVIPDPNEQVSTQYRRAERFNRRTPEGGYEPFWVLWSPEVEKLLGIPLEVVRLQEDRINSLMTKNNFLESKLDDAINETELFQDRLSAFNNLPWYKRVWSTLRGTV